MYIDCVNRTRLILCLFFSSRVASYGWLAELVCHSGKNIVLHRYCWDIWALCLLELYTKIDSMLLSTENTKYSNT